MTVRDDLAEKAGREEHGSSTAPVRGFAVGLLTASALVWLLPNETVAAASCCGVAAFILLVLVVSR